MQSASASVPCSPLKAGRGRGEGNVSSPKANNSSLANTTATSGSVPSTSSPGGERKNRGGKASGVATEGEEGRGGGEMYYCLPWVEACALVTMCSYRSVTRRLSLVLLKEIRSLHAALEIEVRLGWMGLVEG